MADLADFVYSFGSYIYGDSKASFREEQSFRLGNSPGANSHGSKAAPSLFDSRRVVIRFEFQADDSGTLEAAVAEFRAAHGSGLPQVLYIRRYLEAPADGEVTGQFLYAQVEAITGLEYEAPINYVTPEVSFLCADPFYYDDPAIAAALTDSGGNLQYTGTAEGAPLLSLTVGAAGKIVIANPATGDEFTLYPDGAGIYTIDSYEDTEEVRKGGALFELWDGDFIKLKNGANNLTYTKTLGATVTASSATYRNRHR